MSSAAKDEIHTLELELAHLEELERQRKKQTDFEAQAALLTKDHEQQTRARANERDNLVLQNRMSRSEYDREVAVEQAALQKAVQDTEEKIQQLDYQRRLFEKQVREEEAKHMGWVDERQAVKEAIQADPLKEREYHNKIHDMNHGAIRHRQTEEVKAMKRELIAMQLEQGCYLDDDKPTAI